eukprot:SAG31_NODE_14494_length_803_cov_1.416193_1_plen_216_part_10
MRLTRGLNAATTVLHRADLMGGRHGPIPLSLCRWLFTLEMSAIISDSIFQYNRTWQLPQLVTVGPSANPAQRRAAHDVARFLENIAAGTATWTIENASTLRASTPQIAVGLHAAALLGASGRAANFDGLGTEGFVALTWQSNIILSGGRESLRGELYAVNYFLEQIGVRFLAPDVTVLPKQLPSTPVQLYERHIPSFEFRQQFTFQTNMAQTMPQY